MGVLRRAVQRVTLDVTIAALVAQTSFAIWTRNSPVHPLGPEDPLLASAAYAHQNPNRNPQMKDVCVRRVPLDRIRPELLEREGGLVEAFCAGVWSGWGECSLPDYFTV